MDNQATKKTKNKYDWDKYFALLEKIQKEGVWVSAPKDTPIGSWLRYCRGRKEKLSAANYVRFQKLEKMGFEWKKDIWENKQKAKGLSIEGMIVLITEENPNIPDKINGVSKSAGKCPSVTTLEQNVTNNEKLTLNLKAVPKATIGDTHRPITYQDTCKKDEVNRNNLHTSQNVSNIPSKKQKVDNSNEKKSSVSLPNLNVTEENVKQLKNDTTNATEIRHGIKRPSSNTEASGTPSSLMNDVRKQMFETLKNNYDSRMNGAKRLIVTLTEKSNALQDTINKQNSLNNEIKKWKEHWVKQINYEENSENYYISTDIVVEQLKSVIHSLPNESTINSKNANCYPTFPVKVYKSANAIASSTSEKGINKISIEENSNASNNTSNKVVNQSVNANPSE